MSVIDVESLLAPISEDSHCGEDLEYDPAYMEVMRQAEGTPEQQIGDSVIEAAEPNWREIRESCKTLATRTHDLRLALLLTLALMNTDGVDGLRDGLAYIHGLLEHCWPTLHPALDPDDGNDPTERVMILDALAKAPGTFGDTMRFQDRLRNVPVTDSKQVGRFSLRQVLQSSGELEANPDEPPPDAALINAAFEDTEAERLTAMAEAAAQAGEHMAEIDRLVTEQAGAGAATDLSSFAKALDELKRVLDQQLAQRGLGEEPEGDEGAGESGSGGSGPSIAGEIRNTKDVLLAMDKIVRYYETHEPSSPVPLLIRRAKRLVSVSFLDIIRDLSPDAISQVQSIGGIEDEA